MLWRECTGHSNNTREDFTHGHHQMVNTEFRLIISFAAKDGEALYSQQKQDRHRYTYIPSLLKLPLYWRIYLQGSNGETDIQNTLMDMGRGEEKVRCMERITWKLTFAVWLRKLKQTHFVLSFFPLSWFVLPDCCALLDWPSSTIVVGKSTG